MLPILKEKFMTSRLWIIPLRGVLIFGMLAIVAYVYAPLRANAVEYTNPIGAQAQSFPELLKTIAKAIIQVGTPLAAAAIIIIGIRFVIAAASGDQAGLTNARKYLWYVLIGTAIIVGSSAIAEAIINWTQNK